MGVATKIQWTDHTFNPWRGCTKVSPGCTNCYAETLSHRNPKVLGVWGDSGTRVVASESMWHEPLKWDREAREAGERRRVFCASLADVFEDRSELNVPRARLWSLIAKTQSLDWLLLTKRPENVRRLLSRFSADTDETAWEIFCGGWPSNVWLGTSVEDQRRADERIPELLKIPAAVRFLSIEPLLGPIALRRGVHGWIDRGPSPAAALGAILGHNDAYSGGTLLPPMPGIDWVIVGGESGPNARPCDLAWIRSIRDQCRAAGVACFIKQLGAVVTEDGEALFPAFDDPKGGDWDEWPEDIRVREFPR